MYPPCFINSLLNLYGTSPLIMHIMLKSCTCNRRDKRGRLCLVFFSIITEANNPAADSKEQPQRNVIDFNLTAGLHTFV